jgi:hypothetical protein
MKSAFRKNACHYIDTMKGVKMGGFSKFEHFFNNFLEIFMFFSKCYSSLIIDEPLKILKFNIKMWS